MDQEEIYQIADKFVPEQWTKFARTKLKVEDGAMEEIDRRCRENFPEKKYQTIKEWGKKNGNDCTLLRKLKHEFFCENWQEEPQVSAAEFEHTPAGDAVDEGRTIIDDSSYEMTGKKGCVLIISNSFQQSVSCKSRETATNKDLAKMKELWVDKLGCKLFDNKVHRDKTAEEMKELLQGLAKVKDSDYVVAVISTHGGIVPEEWALKCEDNPAETTEPVQELMQSLYKKNESQSHAITEVMFGNDERPFRLRELKKIFYNVNSKELHDIPKFIILGYCRGNITDVGVLKNAPEIVQPQALPTACTGFLETLMPTVSDVLVAYSTHETFQSFEGIDGTWLISSIAEVFAKYHGTKHVVDMLTIVNRRIKAKAGCHGGGFCKAMSIYESSLVKDFFL